MDGLRFEWNREIGWARTVTNTGHLSGAYAGRAVDVQEYLSVNVWTKTFRVSHSGGGGSLKLYPGIRIFGWRLVLTRRDICLTGDPEFDQKYLIRAGSQALIDRIFGNDATLRHELQRRNILELRIEPGRIICETTGRMRTAEKIRAMLDLLCTIAKKLDS